MVYNHMVDTIFAGFLSMHVFEVLHGIIRYQLTPGAVVRKKVFFSCMSGCNKGFGHKCPYST